MKRLLYDVITIFLAIGFVLFVGAFIEGQLNFFVAFGGAVCSVALMNLCFAFSLKEQRKNAVKIRRAKLQRTKHRQEQIRRAQYNATNVARHEVKPALHVA